MPIIGQDPNLPNYAHPEYVAVAPDLKLIADELGGTRSMWEASKEYIRKWTAEQLANYDIRRKCETFFEGLGRTLSAAIGMLFAKPPAMDWNASEAAVKAHWDNIDLAGTAGNVFVKRFAEAAVRDGFAILLVDHPLPPAGTVITAENEVTLNLRPTWAMYTRGTAINWDVAVINNQKTLSMLVLYEPVKVRTGRFGVKRVHRYRILRLQSMLEARELIGEPMSQQELSATAVMPYWATWEVWELKDEAASDREDAFQRLNGGVFRNREAEPAATLPISIGYTGRTDEPMQGKLPLLGVAWANLSHWQLSTDLRFNVTVAGFAQPTVIGELVTDDTTGKQKSLEIGPLVAVHLKQGGDFKWTEAAGTGLERLANLVLAKLSEMAQQGLSFLQTDTRAAETAEAKRLDASAEDSTLATAAQGIEDAVNMAFVHHAWYVGIPGDGAPVLTISRDFENTAMDSPIMVAYVEAVQKAGVPVRLLLEAWQQGGRIKSDEDLDQLEMEIMANQEAQRQAEADAAEAQAKAKPELVK